MSNKKIIHPQEAEPPKIDSDDESDEDNTWYPGETFKETINSLVFFNDKNLTPENVSKEELINSYKNFDKWLKSEVYKIVEEEKKQEDRKNFGGI